MESRINQLLSSTKINCFVLGEGEFDEVEDELPPHLKAKMRKRLIETPEVCKEIKDQAIFKQDA